MLEAVAAAAAAAGGEALAPARARAALRSSYRRALRIVSQWPRDLGRRPDRVSSKPALRLMLRASLGDEAAAADGTADPASGRARSGPAQPVDYAELFKTAEANVQALTRLLASEALNKHRLSEEFCRPPSAPEFYPNKVAQAAQQGAPNPLGVFF